MMPERIQLSRAKGWRMPENTVKVSRPGRWGNPYYVNKAVGVEQCIALYRNTVQGFWSPSTVENLNDDWAGWAHRMHTDWIKSHPMGMHGLICELRGKNLACWCKLGEPCHADVLLELANPAASIGRASSAVGGQR